MPPQPIIAWDYLFAPNAQKSRLYLHLTSTPFSICEQPFALPRPDLTALGITYRRVPVLSIGKDVFPDNASFLGAMQELLRAEGEGRQLRESIWDGACEAWGYRSFWIALACLPGDFITEELAKDRADLFPVFARKDFGELQNSARSEFRAFLDGAEKGFLKDDGGPFVGGEREVGLADVHAVWMVKWYVSFLLVCSRLLEGAAAGEGGDKWLETINVTEQTWDSKAELPRVHKWIGSLPKHAEAEKAMTKLSAAAATEQLLASDYALPDIGVDEYDQLGLASGDRVSIEPTDAKPGTYPQLGELVGLNKMKTVVQLENGLRLHFPKVGYNVKRAC